MIAQRSMWYDLRDRVRYSVIRQYCGKKEDVMIKIEEGINGVHVERTDERRFKEKSILG